MTQGIIFCVKQKIDAAEPPPGYTDHDIERLHFESDPDDKGRDRFQRDHDRLTHSPAFRRLQGKTQVLTPGEADFFRTRLTHSLEVAQVARRLAQKLGANRDLCEASALLHDLGHPPFAHAGEVTLSAELDRAAKKWELNPVNDVGGFNGNAQSFRLAVRALSHKSAFRGLDLTRGVLDGAIKYPWTRKHKGAPKSNERWCFFPTESDDAAWVREGVPPGRELAQSVEAQIVEWADDVAYSIHDVEDWYRARFMPLELLVESGAARKQFANQIADKLTDKQFDRDAAAAEVVKFFRGDAFTGVKQAFDGSSTSKKGIHVMRSILFDEFIDAASIADPNQLSTRHNNKISIDPLAKLHSKILKKLLDVHVLAHPRMATYEMGQAHVIRVLFRSFVDALDFDPKQGAFGTKKRFSIFPSDTQEALKEAEGNPPELLRLVADHIAGMTDSYAIRLSERMTGVGIGSFNEFV